MLKARAEGRIASLDDPIGTYLPGLGDASFRAIPITQFLRMTSGIVFEADGKKAIGGEAGKDHRAYTPQPVRADGASAHAGTGCG